MKKRLLICIVLCVVSALCALCLVACGGGGGNGGNSGEVTVDGVVYSLNDDKESYTLKDIKTPTDDTDFIVPSEVKGKPVTAIARSASSWDCTHFKSITVPDSVVEIGWAAFRTFTGVESITIPFVGEKAVLTDPDNGYFTYIFGYSPYTQREDFLRDIAHLKKVTVTNGTAINDRAFSLCENLEEIILPDTLTRIGERAFSSCFSLKSIVIPDNVTEIADAAFMNCDRLRKVTLGRSVTTIGSFAFYCNRLVEVCNLSSLEIKKDSGMENGFLGDVLQHLYGEGGRSRIEVSDDGYVFVSNPDNNKYFLIDYDGSETELVLPAKYFGMNYEVWYRAFTFSDSITKITVAENVTWEYRAFNKIKNLREAVILADVENINRMFEDCESLTTVTLPASVRHFGWEPFKNCNNLKDIYFGGTMEAWNEIYKGESNWNVSNAVTVHCADGNLDRDGNQI